MDDNCRYILSKKQKAEISQNLIDILLKKTEITEQTIKFIDKWICFGPDKIGKTFFDVWDIVLSNYMPKTRPILYRVCERITKNGRIASFTGRFESVNKLRNGRNFLIICDTKEALLFEKLYCKQGYYKHTFYPLASVLKKAKISGQYAFDRKYWSGHIGEDEYIMKVNFGRMHSFRWTNND